MWLVRPGEPDSVPGLLTLERESLTFVAGPEPGTVFPIPLNRIARARRRRLTPILDITYTSARAEHAVVFFYFASPPPLPRSRSDVGRRPGFGLLPTKGLEQTASAMSLRMANKRLKGTIDEWVEAIRGTRGAG